MNTISCRAHRSHDDIDHHHESDHHLTLVNKNHRGNMSSSSSPPSCRGVAKDSSSVKKDASTPMKPANSALPPSLSQSAESFGSSHYNANPKKRPDRFWYGYVQRRRQIFVVMLLLLTTGSCDGMKNTTTHHVLPVKNIIYPMMHHENSLHDTYDDHRMVKSEKTDIDHSDGSRSLQQNCVYNQNDILTAISLDLTKIDLCSSYIAITSAISVFSKYINVTCNVKVTNGVKCILDAQGLSRHFDVYNATLYLYDIIFINGNTLGYGGATYVNRSSVAMYRCDFRNNSADFAGAIYSNDSTLFLTGGKKRVTVAENNAANNYGGFLYALYSTINITNYLFRDNSASQEGGVIYIDHSTTLSAYRCDFTNNFAEHAGGAISSYDSTVILTGGEANVAVAENNQVTDSYAGQGGFLFGLSSNIFITNYLFLNNSAAEGGALVIESSTMATYRCDFRNNFADYVGGAIVSIYSTLTMTAEEAKAAVAENNEALYDGGFLAVVSSTINVTNHLFLSNSAANGGANVQLNGSSYYENVILRNNSALKQGGAFAIAFENMTLRNVVFEDNNAINGTIRSFSSEIDLKDYSFLSSDPTMGPCNLFVSQLNISVDEFLASLANTLCNNLTDIDGGSPLFESCINFPTLTSIDNRRLDTKSIQAHNHKHSTMFDPNDQMNPSDHLFLITNTSSESQLSMTYNSSPQRMMKPPPNTVCIRNYDGVTKAVKSAKPKSSPTPTKIKLCNTRILLTKRPTRGRLLQANILDGIDISNKNIVFLCSQKRGRKSYCILDGGGTMRHFYGSDTKVQFRNIRFVNGYHENVGGSLLLNNSDVTLTTCSFRNNTALSGAGAVFVDQTKLIINGMETDVSQNGGSGAPIEVHSSNATVQNVAFADNTMSQFGDGIFVFESAVELLNLSFNQTSSNMGSDCNVFVSVNPINRAANATCVAL